MYIGTSVAGWIVKYGWRISPTKEIRNSWLLLGSSTKWYVKLMKWSRGCSIPSAEGMERSRRNGSSYTGPGKIYRMDLIGSVDLRWLNCRRWKNFVALLIIIKYMCVFCTVSYRVTKFRWRYPCERFISTRTRLSSWEIYRSSFVALLTIHNITDVYRWKEQYLRLQLHHGTIITPSLLS